MTLETEPQHHHEQAGLHDRLFSMHDNIRMQGPEYVPTLAEAARIHQLKAENDQASQLNPNASDDAYANNLYAFADPERVTLKPREESKMAQIVQATGAHEFDRRTQHAYVKYYQRPENSGVSPEQIFAAFKEMPRRRLELHNAFTGKGPGLDTVTPAAIPLIGAVTAAPTAPPASAPVAVTAPTPVHAPVAAEEVSPVVEPERRSGLRKLGYTAALGAAAIGVYASRFGRKLPKPSDVIHDIKQPPAPKMPEPDTAKAARELHESYRRHPHITAVAAGLAIAATFLIGGNAVVNGGSEVAPTAVTANTPTAKHSATPTLPTGDRTSADHRHHNDQHIQVSDKMTRADKDESRQKKTPRHTAVRAELEFYGDTISYDVVRFLKTHGDKKITGTELEDKVAQTLKINGKSEAQARKLPVGYPYLIPLEASKA